MARAPTTRICPWRTSPRRRSRIHRPSTARWACARWPTPPAQGAQGAGRDAARPRRARRVRGENQTRVATVQQVDPGHEPKAVGHRMRRGDADGGCAHDADLARCGQDPLTDLMRRTSREYETASRVSLADPLVICPRCEMSLHLEMGAGAEDWTACPVCGAQSHADCWAVGGGCYAPGCAPSPAQLDYAEDTTGISEGPTPAPPSAGARQAETAAFDTRTPPPGVSSGRTDETAFGQEAPTRVLLTPGTPSSRSFQPRTTCDGRARHRHRSCGPRRRLRHALTATRP